jgi:hemerythrin superfamily protein
MNAIELLETQHRDIDDLFAHLRAGGGAKERQRWFDDLADLLAIHASIEELHFYPSVKALQTAQILDLSAREHLGIKRKLATLMATRIDGDKFQERLQALEDEVKSHVQEERTELFPMVERLMDPDMLEALGQEMTSTMAELQQGRPRFDVPLQTLAPMPLAELPTQGPLSSRLMPRVSRLLALPLQALGAVRMVRNIGRGFVDGVRRGLARQRRRPA